MDIPRCDFTSRFELMETLRHPICTDKAERPRGDRPFTASMYVQYPPYLFHDLHHSARVYIARRDVVGLSDYAFLIIRARNERIDHAGYTLWFQKRNVQENDGTALASDFFFR